MQTLAVERGIHEMRGLLIAGEYAKWLLQERAGPLTDAQKRYASVIVQNTKKLERIAFFLGRIAECRHLHPSRFRIADVLEEGLRECGRAPRRADGTVRFPLYVVADRTRLREAIVDVLRCGGWSAEPQVRTVIERDMVAIIFQTAGGPCQGAEHDAVVPSLVKCEEIIRFHGGCLTLHQASGALKDVQLRLPIETPAVPKGSHD